MQLNTGETLQILSLMRILEHDNSHNYQPKHVSSAQHFHVNLLYGNLQRSLGIPARSKIQITELNFFVMSFKMFIFILKENFRPSFHIFPSSNWQVELFKWINFSSPSSGLPVDRRVKLHCRQHTESWHRCLHIIVSQFKVMILHLISRLQFLYHDHKN